MFVSPLEGIRCLRLYCCLCALSCFSKKKELSLRVFITWRSPRGSPFVQYCFLQSIGWGIQFLYHLKLSWSRSFPSSSFPVTANGIEFLVFSLSSVFMGTEECSCLLNVDFIFCYVQGSTKCNKENVYFFFKFPLCCIHTQIEGIFSSVLDNSS